jgi:lipopolysaccharide transport system ATP-binding protein
VFVSHDIGAVKSMCQWVVLLDKGEVAVQGSAEQVADEYLKRAHARGNVEMSALRGKSTYPRWGSGEVEVVDVELLGRDKAPALVFQPGEPFQIRLRYRAHKDCENPVFGVGLYRADGTYVNGVNHLWREHPIELGPMRAGESGEVELEAERLALLQGQYYLTTFLYDHGKAAPTAVDHREHVLTFQVVDARRLQHGLLFLPYHWRVTRRGTDGSERILESRT